MGRNYYAIVEVTDYGPYTTKLVLPMPCMVKAENVSKDSFSVYVERKDEKGEILQLPKNWLERDVKEPSKGYIQVLNAYPSCRYGGQKEEAEYVTLELQYGPLYPLASTMSAPHGMNEMVICDYQITQIAEIAAETGRINGLMFDICAGRTMPYADEFRHDRSTYEELPLNYGYYVPQVKAKGKRPLIIWLHGAGEGGSDPTVAYAGNKVVNLAAPKIQDIFGGAYVLVPQAPTFWMDDGSGRYGKSGKSMYVKALKAAIDEFIDRNDAGIDRKRVYIGGDSNGGFMTMRMVIDYPKFWAAAFPVCEALYDRTISDKDIQKIKHVPFWFTHSKNDPVVDPDNTAVAAYKRLKEAGAENVHFTYWDKVVDLYDQFKDEKGEPYEYNGHFCWIYVYNNECKVDYDEKPVLVDGKEVTIMEWLALQKK